MPWLVSMEICPEEIFISIWYLSLQIQVHKGNTRTQCETSKTYSSLVKQRDNKTMCVSFCNLPQLFIFILNYFYTHVFITTLNK